jgi:Yip1 domain
MESDNEQSMNPWTSIWLKPRATIQNIVDSNPTRWVLLLAALAGFSSALDQASLKSMGDKYEMPVIFVMAAIAGPICGIIGLYIGGALLRWTGAWIGGQDSAQHIRAAVAWSSVPYIWALLLWIPAVLLFGNELFTIETPVMDANLTLLMMYLGVGVLQLAIAIWAIIVFLKCLGQVQGFSAWKALGNTVLAVLVILAPIMLLIVGLAKMV